MFVRIKLKETPTARVRSEHPTGFRNWHIAKFCCAAKTGRNREKADVAGSIVGSIRSRLTRGGHHDVASGAPGFMPCL
jgi:hypothetical protein